MLSQSVWANIELKLLLAIRVLNLWSIPFHLCWKVVTTIVNILSYKQKF